VDLHQLEPPSTLMTGICLQARHIVRGFMNLQPIFHVLDPANARHNRQQMIHFVGENRSAQREASVFD
jgi:hypothetical protein